MGSGSSRRKKVAPACVSEINVYQRDDNTVHSLKEESRSFKPGKIPKFANFSESRNRARQDCHSEGHDSEFSGDDDDIDVELDQVLSEYENRGIYSKRKSSQMKSFIRSKTYGFCNSRKVHNVSDFNSTPQLPRRSELSEGALACPCPDISVEDNGKKGVFNHFRKHTPQCPNNTQRNDLVTRGASVEPCAETDSVPGSSHGPSLAMPVILYDGSEEELMDTIEKEFS